MDLTQTLRRNFVRYLVEKQIFCPITDEVLDIDTCVVILDADGDPYSVISPEAYRRMVDTGVPVEKMLAVGFSFDPDTLPVLG